MDDLKKEDFIKKLSNMTIDEINEFIKQKGKRPKPIPLIYFADKEDKPL